MEGLARRAAASIFTCQTRREVAGETDSLEETELAAHADGVPERCGLPSASAQYGHGGVVRVNEREREHHDWSIGAYHVDGEDDLLRGRHPWRQRRADTVPSDRSSAEDAASIAVATTGRADAGSAVALERKLQHYVWRGLILVNCEWWRRRAWNWLLRRLGRKRGHEGASGAAARPLERRRGLKSVDEGRIKYAQRVRDDARAVFQ